MAKKAEAAEAAEEKVADEVVAIKDPERQALFGKLSEEELSELTEEERAGIEGGELDDDEEAEEEEESEGASEDDDADDDVIDDIPDAKDAKKAKKSDEEDAEKEEDAEEAEGEEDSAEEEDEAAESEEDEDSGEAEQKGDDADAEAEDEGEAEEAVAADDEPDPLDLTRTVMPSEWALPENADEKIKQLDAQAVDLDTKFDEGDLTAKEYRAQLRDIENQRNDLVKQVDTAKAAWNRALSDWAHKTVPGFMRDHKQYKSNETLQRMLDAEVRALQEKSEDKFNPRILRQAHANLQKLIGKTAAADGDGEKPKPKQPKLAGKPGAKPPKGEKPKIPPTLARTPNEEIDDAGGVFARLDRLSTKDPAAYEAAVERLKTKNPAAYEAYLAGG